MYRVHFRRSCVSVEEATLDVNADNAAEALEKAKWLASDVVDLEWHEDHNQFEELERTAWVDNPS